MTEQVAQNRTSTQSAEAAPAAPIPITILTGFLGAGKTTLLNRILHGDHGLRIAVLVNDFGAVNIDSQLIVGVEEDTISLANGCICCTIRDDLIAATRKLVAREIPPEYILVETSGVSDPAGVARSFLVLGETVRVDGIVTVVDTEQIQGLEGQSMFLAMEQIGIADIVMLNKVDLVDEEKLLEMRTWIRRMVPGARVLETVHAEAPLALLLGVGHYMPERLAARRTLDIHVHPEPGASTSVDAPGDGAGELSENAPLVAEHAHHDHSLVFSTWTYVSPHALDVALVQRAVDRLPLGIYRAKGFLRLVEPVDRPGILQMVGRRARITAGEPWGEREPHTQLVFIGEQGAIDPQELARRFDACRPGKSSRLRNWLEDVVDWVRHA
jgi:G3E family GTPase